MGIVNIVLFNVVLIPCAIVLALYLLGCRPWTVLWKRSDAPAPPMAAWNPAAIWTAGLACGAAYMTGHALLTQIPKFPPIDVGDWIYYAAAAGVLVSLVEAMRAKVFEASGRTDPWSRRLRAGVMFAAVYLMFGTLLSASMPHSSATFLIAGLAVAGWMQWELLAGLSRRVSSAGMISALFPAAIGVSAALSLSGTARFGMFGGVICSCMGVLLVASLVTRALPLARGMICVTVPVLYLLILGGRFLAELTTANAALLFAAPLAAWVGEIPAIQRLRPWQVHTLRIGAVLALTAAAVAVAYSGYTPIQSGEE